MADALIAMSNGDFLMELWRDWSPNYSPETPDELVRAALAAPENLAAALGYYRVMLDPTVRSPELQPFADAQFSPGTVPVLYLHGAHDGCVQPPAAADVLRHLAPDSRMEVVENAGHFLHLEQPSLVNALITAWLKN